MVKNNVPVSVAILGSGAEAERIAAGYLDNGIAISKVWDVDAAQCGSLAKKIGSTAAASLEQILEDSSLVAVEVCTAPDRRATDSLSAIRAGKYISVRAPISSGMENIGDLVIEITNAEERFRYLEPLYHHAPHALAKKLLENDEIGMPNGIRIKVAAADVARLDPAGIEEPLDRLALMQWYVGRAEEVETMCGKAAQVSILKFAKPHVYGNFEAVKSPELIVPFSQRPWDEAVEITGASGIIWVNGFWGTIADRPPVVMRRYKRMINFGADVIVDPRGAYKRAAREFIRGIEKGEFPRPGIDEAVSDLKLLLAAAKSATARGRVKIE